MNEKTTPTPALAVAIPPHLRDAKPYVPSSTQAAETESPPKTTPLSPSKPKGLPMNGKQTPPPQDTSAGQATPSTPFTRFAAEHGIRPGSPVYLLVGTRFAEGRKPQNIEHEFARELRMKLSGPDRLSEAQLTKQGYSPAEIAKQREVVKTCTLGPNLGKAAEGLEFKRR